MRIHFDTERLYFRNMTEADAGNVLRMNADPQVLQYIHERPLTDEADALQILRDIIFPQYEIGLGRWAVIRKSDDAYLGWCGLKQRPELASPDLGYRFFPAYWGQGYGLEAAQATLDHGFDKLSLPAISAAAHVDNIASNAILRKIGMIYIQDDVIDGDPVHLYLAENPNNC